MSPRGTVRGEGDPITARESVALGESEYRPETDEVRHVVTRNDDGPVERTTEPFAAYARRECATVASEAVLSAIEDRIEGPVEGIDTGARIGDHTDIAVLVDYTVWFDGDWSDGDAAVRDAPAVDFPELVAVTPRAVEATVELSGRETCCDVPVLVRETEAQLL